MKKDTIGFGIIGCGNVGDIHASSIVKIDNARLIAVCDSDYDKAKNTGKKYQTNYFQDYQKLLYNKDIDVINVCLPNGMHMDICIEAANAGKHILCEKPLEVTLDRIDLINAAVNKNKVKLGVILQKRMQQPSKSIKEILDKERLGKIISGSLYLKGYRTQDYYDSARWRGTWQYGGGGCLMNQGIHDIDLLQWFIGPVESVFAVTDTVAHKRIEVEDVAVALVKFKNKGMGVIEASTSCYPGFPSLLSIYGTLGTINLNDDKIQNWDFINPMEEDKKLSRQILMEREDSKQDKIDLSDPIMLLKDRHKLIIEDMVNAVINDGIPAITGEEARKSVEIILAIYQSAKTMREVTLPI